MVAVAVALLWACLIGEKLTLRRAHAEYARAMRDVRMLRQQQQQIRMPVSAPVPRLHRPSRPVAG
jgi:hypothetical protein